MKKIAREVAELEFNQWLDFKKVRENKRTENKQFENLILDAMETGDVTIDGQKNINFKLSLPILDDAGKPFLETFVFKPRIQVHELNNKLKGIAPADIDGRIAAYIAAISGQNIGLVGKMYTEDYSICQAVAMYFL